MGLKTIYLLKDLARASGYSVYTVEYYLKEGLIQEFGRGPSTGYRYFDEKSVRRLLWVRGMRKMGKSISQIKTLLNSKRVSRRKIPGGSAVPLGVAQ